MKENLLLAALPRKERDRLDPHLESVTLDQGEVLIEADEPIKFVLFPHDLVTSTIQGLSDGTQLEVGLMGIEGMIGIQFWLRQKTTPARTVVQVPGTGLRMKADVFKREVMERPSPLNELVASYTHAFMARMLGANRATVSLTAATIQQAGYIRYTHGKLAVLDSEGLEDVACECYRIVKKRYEEILNF